MTVLWVLSLCLPPVDSCMFDCYLSINVLDPHRPQPNPVNKLHQG